jgi:hypothetical protein
LFVHFLNSGGPSFLGPSYGPFVIDADPAAPEFAVRDISLPAGVAMQRSLARQAALRDINRFERGVEAAGSQVKSLDEFYQKAYSLMTSQQAKEAFDIGREPQDLSATILHVLGIDYKQILHTPLGRPVPVVDGGKLIAEVV